MPKRRRRDIEVVEYTLLVEMDNTDWWNISRRALQSSSYVVDSDFEVSFIRKDDFERVRSRHLVQVILLPAYGMP